MCQFRYVKGVAHFEFWHSTIATIYIAHLDLDTANANVPARPMGSNPVAKLELGPVSETRARAFL